MNTAPVITHPPNIFIIPEVNIVIGISNPTSKLEVAGIVDAEGFTINGVPIGTSTNYYWEISEDGNIYFTGDVEIQGDRR